MMGQYMKTDNPLSNKRGYGNPATPGYSAVLKGAGEARKR
jgi:hypothetical protein